MRIVDNIIKCDKIYIIYVYGCCENSIFQKHDFKFRDLSGLFKKINCITLPFVCFYSSLTMAMLKPKHTYVL
jgi:hypothetical protein